LAAATVFIVDDDPSVRASLTRLMSASGYEAVAFADAEAYLAHVQRDGTAPACVVLDLHLPGLSGLELQQIINRREPRVPVVVLTGSEDPRDLAAARAAGAVKVLRKPSDPAVLLAAVAAAAQSPPPSST
jgi:FixJ family two-component response regulator